MTGGAAPDPGDGPVAGDVGALHRTAVLLTGDADLALDLVAHVLRQGAQPPLPGSAGPAGPAPAPLDRMRTQLVRAYLRSAPRRPDGPGRETRAGGRPEQGADAYDVLRTLEPRARAATVLRVGHGWDLDATAAAVRRSPGRVETLMPVVPGLERALEAIGERHRLGDAEVLAALGDPAGLPPAPGRSRRRRARWLVGAGAAVAVATWSLLAQPDAGADPPPAPDAGTGPVDPDLTPYGWHLDGQGRPPVVAMGLQRQTVVEVPYTAPVREVTWDAGHLLPGGPAAYAVLWCDLPPVDRNIEQPSARLTTGAGTVDLPCAGRDDGPPVRQVTPVPVSGPAEVELVGDLPRAGGAILAFYREGALSGTLPLPGGSPDAPAPPVPTGAAVVDEVLVPRDWAGRTRLLGSVEISAETELRVWAGRTGSVAVYVDGLPVTDDGDLTGADDPDWRGQQLDLRDGRWVVYRPGEPRVFPLPDQLRPSDGRTRTVTVEVFAQGMQQALQVLATQAASAQPGPAVASALPSGSAVLSGFRPSVGAHRLVGAWTVPQDGLGHDLLTAPPTAAAGISATELAPRPQLAPGTELVAFTGDTPPAWGPDRDEGWGLTQHREAGRDVVRPLPLVPGDPDPRSWSGRRLDPWRVQQDLTVPAARPWGAPRVWLPAAPGHPAATVLALEPVAGDADLAGTEATSSDSR